MIRRTRKERWEPPTRPLEELREIARANDERSLALIEQHFEAWESEFSDSPIARYFEGEDR